MTVVQRRGYPRFRPAILNVTEISRSCNSTMFAELAVGVPSQNLTKNQQLALSDATAAGGFFSQESADTVEQVVQLKRLTQHAVRLAALFQQPR
jgi:hypothetical protein